MGLTPIPIFNRKRGTQCYIIQKKTCSNWVQKSLHVKSTNSLMYGKKLLNLIKQNVKKLQPSYKGLLINMTISRLSWQVLGLLLMWEIPWYLTLRKSMTNANGISMPLRPQILLPIQKLIWKKMWRLSLFPLLVVGIHLKVWRRLIWLKPWLTTSIKWPLHVLQKGNWHFKPMAMTTISYSCNQLLPMTLDLPWLLVLRLWC